MLVIPWHRSHHTPKAVVYYEILLRLATKLNMYQNKPPHPIDMRHHHHYYSTTYPHPTLLPPSDTSPPKKQPGKIYSLTSALHPSLHTPDTLFRKNSSHPTSNKKHSVQYHGSYPTTFNHGKGGQQEG
ncbi:hypothetical protein ALUC_10995A [Aspergillus luchuensis]|nr:hypothetical protein ALUC_10995A [Aspergillus luchuensis]